MKIIPTNLKGSFVIEPKVFEDKRGFFYEFFNKENFVAQTGKQIHFVQDNLAKSDKGALRGFHFQKGRHAQAKLVSVLQGAVLDVIIDIRKDSKTFGQHFSIELNDKNKKQLFVPRGFAHAYLCLEDDTLFYYKVDNYYHQESEGGILYNDPELSVDWQFDLSKIILSEKDKKQPLFKKIIDVI
jgi:dTDP-4-dehydrorhamnose 3,5-epimerase